MCNIITSFSCNRCQDIHNAQRNGCSGKPCECDCHTFNTTGTAPSFTQTWTDFSSAGAADVTCNTTVCTDGNCTNLNLD